MGTLRPGISRFCSIPASAFSHQSRHSCPVLFQRSSMTALRIDDCCGPCWSASRVPRRRVLQHRFILAVRTSKVSRSEACPVEPGGTLVLVLVHRIVVFLGQLSLAAPWAPSQSLNDRKSSDENAWVLSCNRRSRKLVGTGVVRFAPLHRGLSSAAG